MLVREWTPMFRILMGVSRSDLLDMSVPEMVDHVDYYRETREAQNG
jgi:hypothetical protein